MRTAAPLVVDSLTVRYGDRVAVSGISFSVRDGEVYCLLGPNGAGKSTTIKAVVGILDRYEGRVLVYGRSPREDPAVKNLIGYVPEEPIVPESLTPRDIVELTVSVRRLGGSSVDERLTNLVHSLEFGEHWDKPVFSLSRGNKQKLLIILSLLHNPRLLVLDEPFTGLDAAAVRVLREYVRHHVSKGNAVLLSTHILDIAERVCARVGIIDRGTIVAEGGLEDLVRLSRAEGGLEDLFLKLTRREEWVYEVLRALEG